MSHPTSDERTQRIDPTSDEYQTCLANAEVRPTKDEHGRPTEIYPGYNAEINKMEDALRKEKDKYDREQEEIRKANANAAGGASNNGTSSGGIQRERSPFWDPVVDSVDTNKKE